MENNHVIMLKEKEKKLEFSGILKEALSIPLRNTNFIIFTLLTSLPLFCFMVWYEILFQRTLVEASKILEPPYSYFYDSWSVATYLEDRLSYNFFVELIQVGFLYLLPLHLLELFNAIVTVNLASKIYKGETAVTIREMVHISTKEARFIGPFITSMYVLFLSTSALLGFIGLVTHYFIISRNIFYGYFFVIFYVAAFIALLIKYLEWSAVCHMSIVLSVVEGIYGTKAFVLADHFGRHSTRLGQLLMLVFFVWGFGLRLPCLYFGCYKASSPVSGVVAQVSLFCVGNVFKWVVCMVYFRDCRNKTFLNEGV